MPLELRTLTYTAVIASVAVAIAVASLLAWPLQMIAPHVLIAELLLLAVVVAHRFPVRFQRQAEATLATVPAFMAVLMLHPTEAIIVAAAGVILAERMRGRPIKAVVFNGAVFGAAAGLAGVLWHISGQNGDEFGLNPLSMLAAGAAGLVLHGANVGLVLGMLAIRKGVAFLRPWAKTYGYEALQEGGLLSIGLIGVLLVAEAWWALVILIIPFVLARYGFERIIHDAVDKAQLADDLRRNLKELQDLQARLIQSAKLASVGTLAAGVAHEINNPIFAISGRAELLLRGKARYLASDKAVEYVQTISEMSDRITKIVRQLLDYSRDSEDKADVPIEDAMDNAVGLLAGKLDAKRLQVERVFPVSPTILGVENQIQQIFVNLIGNAIDATPEWGKITLGCDVEDGMALAYIRDDGVGVPGEVKDKLFEPFFTTKAPGEGTGLGLFICHIIATTHGGEVGVNSKQGEGTTAWVKLPLGAHSELSSIEDGVDPNVSAALSDD